MIFRRLSDALQNEQCRCSAEVSVMILAANTVHKSAWKQRDLVFYEGIPVTALLHFTLEQLHSSSYTANFLQITLIVLFQTYLYVNRLLHVFKVFCLFLSIWNFK